MSEAEFEAARIFAERIIPDGDEPDAIIGWQAAVGLWRPPI